MAELLFAPAVTGLLHLPDVLDRLAAADVDHRDHAHHHHHQLAAHGGHGQARPHGVGGGAPVDVLETPGEFTVTVKKLAPPEKKPKSVQVAIA